jgi:hypothetical protein
MAVQPDALPRGAFAVDAAALSGGTTDNVRSLAKPLLEHLFEAGEDIATPVQKLAGHAEVRATTASRPERLKDPRSRPSRACAT